MYYEVPPYMGDLYLIKTDEDGNVFPFGWERVYGDGPGGVADAGRFVIPLTESDGYITFGSTGRGDHGAAARRGGAEVEDFAGLADRKDGVPSGRDSRHSSIRIRCGGSR